MFVGRSVALIHTLVFTILLVLSQATLAADLATSPPASKILVCRRHFDPARKKLGGPDEIRKMVRREFRNGSQRQHLSEAVTLCYVDGQKNGRRGEFRRPRAARRTVDVSSSYVQPVRVNVRPSAQVLNPFVPEGPGGLRLLV